MEALKRLTPVIVLSDGSTHEVLSPMAIIVLLNDEGLRELLATNDFKGVSRKNCIKHYPIDNVISIEEAQGLEDDGWIMCEEGY